MLIIIGIVIAILFNLIHINDEHEQGIIKAMRYVEHQMKQILMIFDCLFQKIEW